MADEIRNMRLIGHNTLRGFGNIGEGMAIQQAPDGRRIMWLAHESLKNVTALDVSDRWAAGGYLATAEDLVRFGVAHFDDAFLGQAIKREKESHSAPYLTAWGSFRYSGSYRIHGSTHTASQF